MSLHEMDFVSPEKRSQSKEETRELLRRKERELVERRREIIAKLSPEDQEELARVDSEWGELQESKRAIG